MPPERRTYTPPVIETSPPPGFLSLGQAVARRMARQAVEHGRAGRTLLVHGPPAPARARSSTICWRSTSATMPPPTDDPAMRAAGVERHGHGRIPDLVIGSPDAWREQRASGESIVAVARRWLLDAAGAPIAAARRVVLIEHADRANEQIQNALLKALEEPTDRHVFILVADEPGALLPTHSIALPADPDRRRSRARSWPLS